MTKAYRMKVDSNLEPAAKAGATVYALAGSDYGCASDDTRFTGRLHRAVTLNMDGDYPFFTVPADDIEEV